MFMTGVLCTVCGPQVYFFQVSADAPQKSGVLGNTRRLKFTASKFMFSLNHRNLVYLATLANSNLLPVS